jgi:hypothetical protein
MNFGQLLVGRMMVLVNQGPHLHLEMKLKLRTPQITPQAIHFKQKMKENMK